MHQAGHNALGFNVFFSDFPNNVASPIIFWVGVATSQFVELLPPDEKSKGIPGS